MENNLRKFRPSTSWITSLLLTVIIAVFGIFAQTHASECIDDGNSDRVFQSMHPCEDEPITNTQFRPTLNY